MLKITQDKMDFAAVPQTSGVYFFYGPGKKLLYIGKANNLRARIRSHFTSEMYSPAKSEMIKAVKKICWQLTNSGVEALVTEAALIKKHRPFHNIALRDDKSHSFVEITKENFPRIYVTHETFKKPGNVYIGPFTENGTLKTILGHLRRLFPYCTCAKPHLRKCINTEIGKCPGFCCHAYGRSPEGRRQNLNPPKEQKLEYQKNIKNIIGVLTGEKQALVKNFKREMAEASRERNYELAASVRDRISGLEKIFSHRNVLTVEKKEGLETRREALGKIRDLIGLTGTPQKIEIYDISNIQGKFAVGVMAVFKEGRPDKNSYRKFRIRFKNEPDDTGMIKEILIRRLAHHKEWPLPDLFVIDGGQGQLNAALEIIRRSGHKTPVTALAKKEEKLYTEKLAAPLELKKTDREILYLFQSMRDEAHRFAIGYHKDLRKRSLVK